MLLCSHILSTQFDRQAFRLLPAIQIPVLLHHHPPHHQPNKPSSTLPAIDKTPQPNSPLPPPSAHSHHHHHNHESPPLPSRPPLPHDRRPRRRHHRHYYCFRCAHAPDRICGKKHFHGVVLGMVTLRTLRLGWCWGFWDIILGWDIFL